MKTKTEKKKEKRSLIHNIFTVIGAIMCVILLPILIINLTLIVRNLRNEDELASVGGYFPLVVLTDSMNPEIASGDLIIYHTVEAEDVSVGDVIAFIDPAGNGESIVTHRVTEIVSEDGELSFRTKGDATDTEDEELVPAENLKGVKQRNLAGLGNIVLFMQSRTGIIVCVVIPLLLLIVYDMIRRKLYDNAVKKELDELRAAASEEN